MQKPILIIGYEGRMAQVCRNLLESKKIPYKCFGPGVPREMAVDDFSEVSGVIDFSTPEAAIEISKKVSEAGIPWVCGTTGWKSEAEKTKLFEETAAHAAIVVDSNFSLGIEILCQAAELLAQKLGSEPFTITDIHHQYKKDAPSGTSLKLEKRILETDPKVQIDHKDYRIGNIAGEHRVTIAWGDEMIEFTHRASSREAFAQGAVRALNWAIDQKPALYSMKDVFS